MIDIKHTPGPWRIGNLESYEMDGTPFRRVYFPADHLEIQEAHVRGDNCDTNAKLIAAAPDLLHALSACLNFIANTESEMGETLMCGDIARVALAKVDGDLVNDTL